MRWYDIDWNGMWQQEMKARDACPNERLFNDEVERQFWEQLAPNYDERHGLDKEVPGLLDYLREQIGVVNYVREIGPGTGNFTIPLASLAQRWEGIDFSADMLNQLRRKLKQFGLFHVATRHGKWEAVDITDEADVLLAVNSLYRVYDIELALEKMIRTTKQRLVLVRTLQYMNPDQRQDDAALYPDWYVLASWFWQHGWITDVRHFSFQRAWSIADGKQVNRNTALENPQGYRWESMRVAVLTVHLNKKVR